MKDKAVVWLSGYINQRAMWKQPTNGQVSRGR